MRLRHRDTAGWNPLRASEAVTCLWVLAACITVPACSALSGAIDQPNASTGGAASAMDESSSDETAHVHYVHDLTPPGGTPGVDYAPDIIEIGYRANVPIASSLLPSQPVSAEALSSRRNSVLRQNREYEQVTAAIATRYGLAIRNEAYLGDCNIAAFDLPPEADGDAVLRQLRREYAAVLECAGFTPLAQAGFIPDDPDFVDSTVNLGPQWGLRQIGCQVAWEYTRGDPDLWVGIVDLLRVMWLQHRALPPYADTLKKEDK